MFLLVSAYLLIAGLIRKGIWVHPEVLLIGYGLEKARIMGAKVHQSPFARIAR